MPSLRELQRELVASLLSEDPVLPPPIGHHGSTAHQRLGIHRDNCRENFLAALGAGYPVLRRLTGTAYFRQLVRQYQLRHPSPSGNLFHAGKSFPAYLERRFAGSEFAYFADVARLEWLCQEVLGAVGHQQFDPARLSSLDPAGYASLRFALDPAAGLLSSGYPVVTIWEAHQEDADPGAIDLAAGGEQAIVQRRRAGVCVCRLPAADFACLSALAAGRSLADALEEGLRVEPHFDLGASLRRWVQAGWIADFSLFADRHTD